MQTRLENLTDSIAALEREVARLRSEFRRRTAAVVAIVAVTALLGILFARNQIDSAKKISENNQRLCPVISILSNPSGAPATTARGQQIQAAFQRLSTEFDCPH